MFVGRITLQSLNKSYAVLIISSGDNEVIFLFNLQKGFVTLIIRWPFLWLDFYLLKWSPFIYFEINLLTYLLLT